MNINIKKIVTGISLIGLSLLLTAPIVNVKANDFSNPEDYDEPFAQVVPFNTTILYDYLEDEFLVPQIFTYDNYKTLADKYDNGYYETLEPGDNEDVILLSISKSEEEIASDYYDYLTRAYINVDCYNEHSDRLSFAILELEFTFTNILIDKSFFERFTLFYIGFDFVLDFTWEMNGQYSYISRNTQIIDGLLVYDQETDDSFAIHLNMFPNLGEEDAIFIHYLYLEITFREPYFNTNNESSAFQIMTYYMPESLIPSYSIFSSLIVGGGFVDLSAFLESSIGGFLSFEIAPGFSIYIILGVVFGLSFLFAILKIYFGG